MTSLTSLYYKSYVEFHGFSYGTGVMRTIEDDVTLLKQFTHPSNRNWHMRFSSGHLADYVIPEKFFKAIGYNSVLFSILPREKGQVCLRFYRDRIIFYMTIRKDFDIVNELTYDIRPQSLSGNYVPIILPETELVRKREVPLQTYEALPPLDF